MVTPIDIIAFKLARGNNPKGWQSFRTGREAASQVTLYIAHITGANQLKGARKHGLPP